MSSATSTAGAHSQRDRHPQDRILSVPTDGSRFMVFRAVLSVVLIADLGHLYAHLNVFPHLTAWRPILNVALPIWIAALLCAIVGWHSKVALLINYTLAAVIFGLLAPNGGFQQAAGDSVIIGASLLLVVLQATNGAGTRILAALYLCSIYIDSGVHKLFSPMWSSGFGITTPMELPSLVWTNAAWLAWFPHSVLHALGYGVVAFEVLFPALYFWQPTRVLAVLAGAALHVGIGVVYPIPVFAGLMVALYTALLPDRWYGRLRDAPAPLKLAVKPSAVLCVWILCVTAAYAPEYIRPQSLELPLKAIRKAVYMTTGVASHEVFADGMFTAYRYQLRLSDGEEMIPYDRPDGLFMWSVRDRVWEQWWKRTEAPALRWQ